jgi:urea transport system permease protein
LRGFAARGPLFHAPQIKQETDMHESAFLLGQLFNGFSVASLFVLAALGLALSFGLMRVINMAHGEMLMLGGYLAYATLMVVPGPLGIIVAMPVAFLGAALLGGILEWMVIHRLSARPLDTLLATWGVSLILQQAARNIFGEIGVEVTAPAWLDHEVTVQSGYFAGLDLPDTRIFILAVEALVLGAIALLLNKTRVGLYVRAVNQDRPIAAAMGVNARRVDLLVFSLGTGVAGLAGVILALLGPVTPTVGQSYIVPAFLVVILGGLGSLVGTTIASIMIGLFTALIEIFVDVSVAQVLLLVFVILFIQIRPQGIITIRSRALEG